MKLRWIGRPSGSIFLAFITYVAISGSAIVRDTLADENPPLELKSWPAEIWTKLGELGSRGANSLMNAIFDGLDSVDLFSLPFAERNRASIHIERAVYDNFDALGTWTVIDRTSVRADGTPLGAWTTLAESASESSLGVPYASFVFEPQANLEWSDVRQVSTRNVPKRRQLEHLRQERELMRARLSEQYDEDGSQITPDPDPNVTELNPFTPWYYIDPSVRPRFSKVLNLLTFPLRTPLSVKTLQKRMVDGEVISWSFSGRVEVGAAVGWKIIPDPSLETAGIDYRITAVAEGSYRISVLREDENTAKVKLSRTDRFGNHQKLSLGYDRNDLLKNHLIIRGLSVDLSITPFNLEDSSLRGHLFDVGYRYHLQSKDGAEAYHRAVLGSFALSEEFAARDERSSMPAVEKVFERHGKTDDRERKNRTKLAFFLKSDVNKKLSTIDANIELPDGTHHVLSSVAEKQINRRTWFNSNDEKTSRKISVLLDKDLYDKGDLNSFYIIGESFYEDTSTNGKELFRNISEIENFLGKPDLFPKLSYSTPRKKRAWFGRSSFYWGFHLRRPEIEAFLEVPQANRRALVTSLIPERKQESVLKNWDAASDAYRRHDVPEVFRGLKALFGDRRIGWPLMLLIRASVPTPMSAFVTATNSSFDRIQESGKFQTSVDRILTLTDQEMGFEGYAKRQKDDPEAAISEISSEETPEGLIRIRFNLKEDAETLYFRISRPKDFFGARDVVELMYANQHSVFKKGPNTIVLDALSDRDMLFRLSARIRRDRKYLLQIAFSRDTKRFGSLASTQFRAGLAYLRP